MTIEDQIRDELQYDIKGEAAKMSALSQVKLISMNILLVKILKLNLLILLS